MSKKITISVPDDLYEKMKKWKASFNFSQVFQNAMASMIRKKESFQKRVSEEFDFSSIVSRLKAEKVEYENDFLETGKKDGFRWGASAHYSEIQYALNISPGENLVHDEKLGDYFKSMLGKYSKIVQTSGKTAQSRINEFTRNYVEGWKEGVEHFWNEVKDKL